MGNPPASRRLVLRRDDDDQRSRQARARAERNSLDAALALPRKFLLERGASRRHLRRYFWLTQTRVLTPQAVAAAGALALDAAEFLPRRGVSRRARRPGVATSSRSSNNCRGGRVLGRVPRLGRRRRRRDTRRPDRRGARVRPRADHVQLGNDRPTERHAPHQSGAHTAVLVPEADLRPPRRHAPVDRAPRVLDRRLHHRDGRSPPPVGAG
jgi:hypothetical protein